MNPKTPTQTLLIGTDALLAAWERHASTAARVIPITCSDVPRAVDIIELTDAAVIVVEQVVAASAPGAVLMARVHSERSWRGTEVRLMTAEGVAALVGSEPGKTPPHQWLIELSHPLPPRPQRRAPRYRVEDGQLLIDGNEVRLVDVSATGAQVYSSSILRPQRQVRVSLQRAEQSIRTTAVVIWSAFEVSPTIGYRAGIAFAKPIPDAIVVGGEALAETLP